MTAQKGNYFQWRRIEHDKWKGENSYGHTTAGIRHGDTRVRAFTCNSGEDTSLAGVSGMSSKVGNDETCA